MATLCCGLWILVPQGQVAGLLLVTSLFTAAAGRGLLARADAVRTRTAEILDSVLPERETRTAWVLLAAAPGLLVGLPAAAAFGGGSLPWIGAAALATTLGAWVGTLRGGRPRGVERPEESLGLFAFPLLIVVPSLGHVAKYGMGSFLWLLVPMALFEVALAYGWLDGFGEG